MRFFISILLMFGLGTLQAQHALESLPYKYDALEPHIDAKTVEIHYDKHHRAYFNNFVSAIKNTSAEKIKIEEILQNISNYSVVVRNNAGGWYNHTLYWNIMTPGGSKIPKAGLLKTINDTFGSYDELKKQITNKGMQHFGSGWVWLIVNNKGKLIITTTEYQDNPLMNTIEIQGIPILGIDLWEHAYYLKYQNLRKAYIDAFWEVVNWDIIEENYTNALIKLKQ